MKKNLYINTAGVGSELKKSESTKNNTSNFLSIINNRSLTTNESVTAFTSPFNTIAINTNRATILSNKPFLKSKSNKKFSSQNIFSSNKKNNYFNTIFLPKINTPAEKAQLFNNADTIVKERRKHYFGRALKQTKSSILQKSKEICLNNFLITQLKEKRDEINNKQIQIFSQLDISEKRFELDYKNFIDFVEEMNKKEKEEERNLNNLKNISKNIENNVIQEMNKNKTIESKIETVIKQIIVLQTYGSFLHKIFYRPFTLDALKNINLKGKKIISLSNIILPLYDEFLNDYQENIDIISDIESLMDKFTYFGERIVNIIKEKEALEDEIKEKSIEYKNILEQLEERKKNNEKEYNKLKNEKKELNNVMKEYLNYDSNRTNNVDHYLEYIKDLAKNLGINSTLNKNNNQKYSHSSTNEVLECSNICEQIIEFLCEKENLINENINNIEEIINKGNEKDRELIENLIYERKKFNKKEKQLFLINMQKKEDHLKKLKAVEKAKRIIIRGRKVFPDIPVVRNKNKKIKIQKTDDYQDFEYLNYSSEKEL